MRLLQPFYEIGNKPEGLLVRKVNSTSKIRQTAGYGFICSIAMQSSKQTTNKKDGKSKHSNTIINSLDYKVCFHYNPNGINASRAVKYDTPFVTVGNKCFANPNIADIVDVIRKAYECSMFYKKVLPMFKDKEPEGWKLVKDTINEIPCFNYVSKNFMAVESRINLNRNSSESLSDEIIKLYNTHMFMAQAELGYLFGTFRSKTSTYHTMDYCYNPEYVPIYYSIGAHSFLDKPYLPNTDVPWHIYLLNKLQPQENIFEKYSSVPDICKKIVVCDKMIYKSIRGSAINIGAGGGNGTRPVYYLTRLDLMVLSQMMPTAPKSETNGLNHDTYNYKLTMPFLFDSLLRTEEESYRPSYYSPDNWTVKIYKMWVPSSDDDKKLYDYVIGFDVDNDSSDRQIDNVLSYKVFAYYNFMNYLTADSNKYGYDAYKESIQESKIPVTSVAQRGADSPIDSIMSNYENFLKVFFSKT